MSEESTNKNGDDTQEQREKAFQSLSTPLIDISHMSVNNCSQEEVDESKKQKPDELLFAPLHRDGNQARLVEEVRRRQRQQYEETSYTQWFWELLYEYGPPGIIDDPRNTNNNQSIHHSTINNLPIQNPYQDNTRLILNNNKGQSNNTSQTTTDLTKNVYQSVYYPDISKLSKYPRIIRFICVFLIRCLYMLRWCIDFCITKMSCHIKPLQPNPPFPTYSSSPVYDLHITADNIICLLVILLVIFYYSSKMNSIMSPVVVLMCLTVCFVCWKVVDRVQQVHESPSQRKQPQQQQQQQTHANTTAVPKQSIPNNVKNTTQQDEHAKATERLQKQYPGATHAECKRFYKCVNYKEEAASKRLDKFLKWRSECGLKNVSDNEDTTTQQSAFNETKDELDWEECSQLAISIMTKSHISESGVSNLPQIICSYENHETTPNKKKNDTFAPPRCNDGTRILHILPFRLDLSIATAQTYSLAAALYLDRRLSRSSLEFITLFVDVRGGRNWSNPTPWSTLPFIQSTASLLGSHYPERLSKLVLVPMPKSAIWVWSAAQKCLDPNTASKVVVVSSSGDGSSGLPDKLNEFISEESLIILEKRRRSFFVG